ncbi:MAG: glycosyltransferase family 2 protein [Bacteroidia bacterium]|nr:glycosyltransferase family 2 protein [Bacteroidia bacterium]
MTKQSLTVIIPCFNEELLIEKTYQRVKSVLNTLPNFDSFIIFINDGSSDRTAEKLNIIANQDLTVKLIHFSRNFGHQAAVTAGINNSETDIAIIIDADLQDPPELFNEMITLYNSSNCNAIYCVRKTRNGETFFKKITAKYFYKIMDRLSEVPIPLDTGDFRLIDKKIINEFKQLGEKNKFVRGLISWIGFVQIPFYYERNERLAGETKYPLKKMLRFALNGILYFSKKPLKLAIQLGLISTLIAFALLIYILYGYFFSGQTVTGWASTLTIVVFFGGIQLLTIGLVAQYIANIFDEVKGRPDYIIANKVNF